MTKSFPLGLKPSVRSTVTVNNKLLMKVVIQVFGGGRGGVEEWSVGGWVEGEDEQSWVGMVFIIIWFLFYLFTSLSKCLYLARNKY